MHVDDSRKYQSCRHPPEFGKLSHIMFLFLFFSRPVLDPRVRHTMDVLSPFILVLRHSDLLSCPRLDVVHPGRAWPSSPSCTWHCSLHYLFLQAPIRKTIIKRTRTIKIMVFCHLPMRDNKPAYQRAYWTLRPHRMHSIRMRPIATDGS